MQVQLVLDLRTVMTVGNTPATSGQSEYKIKSGLGVGIFKNNPVSLQDGSGDQGYLQDASFATTDDGGSGGAAYDNYRSCSSYWCVQWMFLRKQHNEQTNVRKLSSSVNNIWN